MKNEHLICDYCKKQVPDATDEMPTWFGRYHCDKLELVICKGCLVDNKEKWEKGVK